MDSLEYVKSIDFGKATSPDSSNSLPTSTSPATKVKFVGGVRQADVVSGSIVAFTDALTAQDMEDVTNGTLFAQLAASKKFMREDPAAWYDEYVKVMKNIGFGVQDFTLREYKTGEEYLRLDHIVIDLLKPNISQTEYVLAVDAILKLGFEKTAPLKLFAAETMTMKDPIGNFQLVIVDKDSNGAVTIILGAYYFLASVKSERFLWDTWEKSSLQLFYAVQKATLNETVYGELRETIKEKVAPYLPEKVASIPL